MKLREGAKPLHYPDLIQRYEDMLDECYSGTKIAGIYFYASTILFRVDRIAYDCGFNDWLDAECKSGELIEIDEEYYSMHDVEQF